MFGIKRIVGSPRLVASAILALGGLAIYALDFPGSLEDDSYVQLVEARAASYSNWHPPVMSWLLGLSDSLAGPPEAWFVLFDFVLAFGALIAVVWIPRRTAWPAVAVAAAMLLLPQLMMLQGVVWKDGLFADAALAGFACMALAARHWQRGRWRLGLVAGAVVLLALAILTRQNAIVILPCAALGIGLAAWRIERRRTTALGYGAGVMIAVCALALAGNAALQLRADGYPARQEQFKILELYDITGMVYRDLDLPLNVLERDSPRLAKLIATEGVARWSPIKNDTLEESPRIVAALDATPAPVLARQWREVVFHHPLNYLVVRAILFRWVFQPPEVGLCHPFHVGDQGDPADLRQLGMHERLDARDVALWHYGNFFLFNTPFFSHLMWAIGAGAVLVALWRRRDPADIVLASLIVASYVFTATFFLVSIACDYRYLYLVDLSALAGLLYAAADWQSLKEALKRKGGL